MAWLNIFATRRIEEEVVESKRTYRFAKPDVWIISGDIYTIRTHYLNDSYERAEINIDGTWYPITWRAQRNHYTRG